MPQDSTRRSERLYVGDPETLLATRPGPDYEPIWRIAWRKRRWIGLGLLVVVVLGPAYFVASRPAVVLGNFSGSSGSGLFVEGAMARRMLTIENRMPYDITVTGIGTDVRIPTMSPPGFEIRVGSMNESRPVDQLPEFSVFRLRAHQMVEVHFIARRRCPEWVNRFVENGSSSVGFSSFHVSYRAFGIPARVELESISDVSFPEPTSKECPNSSVNP